SRGVQGDVAAQTEQVMRNVAAVLDAAGMGFGNVVRATIFLADIRDFATVDAIYGRHFEAGRPPARSPCRPRRLPKGALVEIDVVAVA
ncbi:MAG: endoribonuclease L-PSP, partial [Deltaproteobacteria bacterium]|nr:endoribonuclease L-PSP [Deltaproteobacteria bacterium]